MKKLIMLAVLAVAALCEAAPRKVAEMPVDESGWRCEGDCDADTPCRFCNPPPKAKKSAAKKSAAKKSAAKKSAKKSRKSAAKSKKSGARRRSRNKAVETSANEG